MKLQKKRPKIFNFLSHDYLWQPTPVYYLFALSAFFLARKRYKVRNQMIIPFMMLPVTFDAIKRENYVQKFKKERDEMLQSRKNVYRILNQKKQQVSAEQIFRSVTGVNLDRKAEIRPLLSLQMD